MSKTESLTNNTKTFFALLRAGLWEAEVRILQFGKVDFAEIYRLAKEQSVVGLVAAGLDHVVDTKIPKKDLLQFIGATLQMEERNKAMNYFIGVIVDKMRKEGIYTLLVKGQGVALCYERPLWRSSGDVDFYLSDKAFQKAKSFFRPLVQSIDPDNNHAEHINMQYDPWVVEIHANQYCGLSYRIDKVLSQIHHDIFYGGNVRSCELGGTQVFLPSANNDLLIVFTHFLKHFYKGGLGLRQICDWCRLLWTYRKVIDNKLLHSRIRKMGLMSEWKAFSAYAVLYLGMPKDAMPMYDDSQCWERKAKRIQAFIMAVGNFGHNRDSSFYGKYPYLIRKACSLWRKIGDIAYHIRIFPFDSIRFSLGIVFNGFRAVAHRE